MILKTDNLDENVESDAELWFKGISIHERPNTPSWIPAKAALRLLRVDAELSARFNGMRVSSRQDGGVGIILPHSRPVMKGKMKSRERAL